MLETIPIDAVTVKGFIAWLKSCPVWLVISKSIEFECEILANYELSNHEIVDDELGKKQSRFFFHILQSKTFKKTCFLQL